MSEKVSCIGLVLNIDKKDSFTIARRVFSWLQHQGRQVLVEEKAARTMELEKYGADFEHMAKEVELIILFGGDGTFLYTARQVMGSDVPLVGINLGQLGFLTEVEIEEVEEVLQAIINREFYIEKRMLLKASLERGDDILEENLALNDIVINRGANARMICLEININQKYVNSYRADGLIVATPTGSTAYSLSAGGPIVNPRLQAIIITPICPHSLSVRPLIVSQKEVLRVRVSGRSQEMNISIDGSKSHRLLPEDEIVVRCAKPVVKILKFHDRTFYDILHKKMRSGME